MRAGFRTHADATGSSLSPAFVCEQTFWILQALFPILPLVFSSTPGSTDLPSALVATYRRNGSVVETAHDLYRVLFVDGSFPWWVGGGAAALVSLFLGSTWFTEYITAPKVRPSRTSSPSLRLAFHELNARLISLNQYPAYKQAYQKRVAFLWPIQTYAKRIWISVVHGNDARRRIERSLGWGERKSVGKKN